VRFRLVPWGEDPGAGWHRSGSWTIHPDDVPWRALWVTSERMARLLWYPLRVRYYLLEEWPSRVAVAWRRYRDRRKAARLRRLQERRRRIDAEIEALGGDEDA